MPKEQYLEFLDSAKGLYIDGLALLDPEKGETSILSGCKLLIIGIEKLIKHVLEGNNPLLLLEKVCIDDIIDFNNGSRFGRKRTVNVSEGFDRLVKLFPELESLKHHLTQLNRHRNFLLHGSGYYSIEKEERRVRINIANMSEAICMKCLKKQPQEILGDETWAQMARYRDAYKDAEALELKKRLSFLKRLYSKGKKLPCEKVKFLADSNIIEEEECPICGENVIIEFNWDATVGSEGIDFWSPYPRTLLCKNCEFSLSDPDEIVTLLGEETVNVLLYGEPGDY